MAGDWIKFESITSDKPEVFVIAAELNIDPDAVVGKLLRVWAWFDSHSVNGNAPSVTIALLDRVTGVTGFCQALIKAEWMFEKDGVLSLPNFDRHNGKTAKTRALGRKRAESSRIKSDNSNDNSVTKPSPEKRREDIPHTERRPSLGRELISPDFKPDDPTLEYCQFKKLPKITDDVISIFIHSNESSGWKSANWQSEFKKWLLKQKVRYEENKARYDERGKNKQGDEQSGGFMQMLRDEADNC